MIWDPQTVIPQFAANKLSNCSYVHPHCLAILTARFHRHTINYLNCHVKNCWVLLSTHQMWPALPKPTTYSHHVNEQFSPSMDSSINKLTNCQYTTAKCWQVCFCWGLFLRPVRRPQMLRCPLNTTGRLVQATTLLEITMRLVDDIDPWFSYVVWQFECNVASLWAISPWKMQSSAVTRHFMAPPTIHPYISACGVDKKTI